MAGRQQLNTAQVGKTIMGVVMTLLILVLVSVAKEKKADVDIIDTSGIETGNSDCDAQVYFVDVGQGDATLVISDGKTMLIDSGDTDQEDKLISFMRSKGVEKLDYLIVTHPHSDHMGEVKDVLKSFKTEKFIMPKLPASKTPTSYVYQKMLKEIKNQGLKITAASDTEFTLGKCRVQTFTPKKDHDNLNNYSTLVKITCDEKSFLITGDCETEEEKDILSQNFDLKSNVLKVGHHGSSTSSSVKFLKAVSPECAVISCGKDNKYGHPHEETLKKLNNLDKIKQWGGIYVTMDDGTISCFVHEDGKIEVAKANAS